VGAVAQLRDLVDDLVARRMDIVRELNLRYRAQPGRRGAEGDAGDRRLGNRRVDHALRAELREQALGHAEHAAPRADVLAEQKDALVLRQRLRQRQAHGLQ
jgi:hypothetical protein